MKTLFASLIAMAASGATPLFADTAELAPEGCPMTGARTAETADCAALRAHYTEKVGECLAQRRAAAALRTGQSGSVNAHASRASYVACASEARRTLGLSTK